MENNTAAKNNGYSVNNINILKTKLIAKKPPTIPHDDPHNKKWVSFSYLNPVKKRISNLFKHSNMNIAFRATNTIQKQLPEKPTNKDPSGIYTLKCNTCNNVYIGHSGRSVHVRHKEQEPQSIVRLCIAHFTKQT